MVIFPESFIMRETICINPEKVIDTFDQKEL